MENGVYTDRLPSIRNLAEKYDVNLKTVNKAIGVLSADGTLRTERGRGTFVNAFVDAPATDDPADKIAALFVRAKGDMFEGIYNRLVKGLHDNGFFPLLIPHEQDGGSRERLDNVLKLKPRALIIDSGIYNFDYEYLKNLAPRFKKIIFLIQRRDEHEFSNGAYVLSDYFYGSYMAVKHLHELGHRRILLLKHANNSPNALAYRHERIYEFTSGYTMAMEEFGLRDGISVIDMPIRKNEVHDYSHFYSELKSLLNSPGRPTAILSFLDYWLVEAMQVLKELKLDAPRDISMIGCHNTQWTTRCKVPLSSISLREDEIARVAVEKVTSLRNGFGIRTIKPELILRESTAPYRTN